MNKFRVILVSAVFLFSGFANASLIANGDFQTCDFTNWEFDTDGFGPPADTSDFSINDVGGECSAEIGMSNLLDLALADPAQGFANTLFTTLDFSGAASGALFELSFDWAFSGLDLQTDFFSDLFSVSLNDGFGGIEVLFETFEDGSGTFTTVLDSSYDGWFLDFQLQSGFNFESFSSVLSLDNISLESVSVPTPHTSAILLLGLAALVLRRKPRKC